MTSVIGHVLSIDFPPAFQSWETTDPATLFAAPTLKSEANPKVLLHSLTGKLDSVSRVQSSIMFPEKSRLTFISSLTEEVLVLSA